MKTKIKKFYNDHKDVIDATVSVGAVITATVWAATYLTMSNQTKVTGLFTVTNPDDANEKRLVVVQKNGRENWFQFEPGTAA